jgi:hypothetical protein
MSAVDTFPTSPKPRAISVTSVAPTYHSISHSLRQLTRSRGGQFWTVEMEFPPMTRSDFSPMWAFLVKQRGRYKSFNFVMPEHEPLGVATGTPTVNGVHSSGRAIQTQGWTTSVIDIMKSGDFLKFANHDKVYMMTSDANSNESGEAVLNIEPALQESLANGEAVLATDIPFKMRFENDASTTFVDRNLFYGWSCKIVEAL